MIALMMLKTGQELTNHSKSAGVHSQGVIATSLSYSLLFQQHTSGRRRSIILVSPNKHC